MLFKEIFIFLLICTNFYKLNKNKGVFVVKDD